MIILTIRSDKAEAEVGLFEEAKKLAYETWPAHRELSITLYSQIKEILSKSSIEWEQLQGIAVYKGPGSFTGLRIGISAANALALGLQIPVISTAGKNWINDAIKKLDSGQNEKVATPKYGAPPRTTPPKK